MRRWPVETSPDKRIFNEALYHLVVFNNQDSQQIFHGICPTA